MSRLEQIKNEYAKELHFSSWDVFISDYSDGNPNWGDYGKSHRNLLDKHWDIVTERYAKECVKASLDKAFENSMLNYEEGMYYEGWVELDKDSIIDEENIILL